MTEIPGEINPYRSEWNEWSRDPEGRIKLLDPVDNGRILTNRTRQHLMDWCASNTQGMWWVGMGWVKLELEQDRVAFMLRWQFNA